LVEYGRINIIKYKIKIKNKFVQSNHFAIHILDTSIYPAEQKNKYVQLKGKKRTEEERKKKKKIRKKKE